ncbi:MAG TPA: LytTR family DNA-binding domain-containing protein [Clostridia bacterium]|nr:LytTR family DNA-binding domain-containing protein [Clostridia bacterium]
MRVGLSCTDNIRGILLELFNARNIAVDDNSDIYVVETGCSVPDGKVSIQFETGSLGILTGLLGMLSKAEEDTSNTIIGRSPDENYVIIPYAQICYFEGRGNNTFCIAKEGEYRVKEKLYELEARLPQSFFVRVGRSFIVNIKNVNQIVPWFGRRLVLKFMDCRKEVEVSKNYTKSFKEFLDM